MKKMILRKVCQLKKKMKIYSSKRDKRFWRKNEAVIPEEYIIKVKTTVPERNLMVESSDFIRKCL